MRKTKITPTLPGFIQEAIDKNLLNLNTCIPGKVQKYDPATQKAEIVPLIKKKYTDDAETEIEIPPLNNVPVYMSSCNNRKTFITIPVKVGDIGMVIFCTRSIDNFLSTVEENSNDVKPLYHDNSRHHDFSDAWFIPGILPFGMALQNVSSDDIIISNDAFIINIKPDGKITINNGTNELIETLSTLIQNLITAQVVGDIPFKPDTITLLTKDKSKIDSFK